MLPPQVAADRRFRDIQVGMYHTCAITVDMRLYCWGQNRFREATGENVTVRTPRLLFPNVTFEYVVAGGNDFSGHTCGLSSKRDVRCWGDNRKGQLGPFGIP